MTDITATDAPTADAAAPDAIALLESDHRKVEGLFVQYEAAGSDDDKKALADQICLELKIHTMIEEEIFYPALDGKTSVDLVALGGKLKARKEELLATAQSEGLPPAESAVVRIVA